MFYTVRKLPDWVIISSSAIVTLELHQGFVVKETEFRAKFIAASSEVTARYIFGTCKADKRTDRPFETLLSRVGFARSECSIPK